MNFKEYQDGVKRTVAHLQTDFNDQLHMSIGISTEANEVLDAYKKALAYGKPLDVVNVREELGDILWYMANLMRMLDIDFEETLEINLAKLKARYPDKFTTERATNRNLEVERSILEGATNSYIAKDLPPVKVTFSGG